MAFAIGFAIFAIFVNGFPFPTPVRAPLARFAPLPAQSVHFFPVRLIVAPIVEPVAIPFIVTLPQSDIAQFAHGIIGATEHRHHAGGNEPVRQLLRRP
ncbi:hypothetical protein [Bifidobacterium adolescentis]|uniref:hypothetical protein n=1 Tax=Bifidobacterium adolescentis TaxID=1680 RepID=UPI0034A4356B